ncbi:unnamed protein product [Owenia fusiformis]|uniref:Enoyl-CoA delta isomerase 1, mitochondrial n=1 Tax=Owenia fusiformis TaxID=6347 RepID=A0A8J1U6E5_OWEFU|nr:unnamed protein product [Owenia fusiformis]
MACIQKTLRGLGVLRQLPRESTVNQTYCRYASSYKYLQVDLDKKTKVAHLTLARKPANSLNCDMMKEIAMATNELDQDRDCKGIIINSCVPNIFSAGLDLTELYQAKELFFQDFWRSLQAMFSTIYGTKVVTMAAIEGHAPAAGCIIALATDYRVMSEGKFNIGLNESMLGIPMNFWVKDAFIATCGQREGERALQLGQMFIPSTALQIGLVDEVVPQELTLPTVQKHMKQWVKVPGGARGLTKSLIRQQAMDNLKAKADEDLLIMTRHMLSQPIQNTIGAYLENMTKKSKR